MTARISLIREKARGHSLRLRATALALRGPRLQFGKHASGWPVYQVAAFLAKISACDWQCGRFDCTIRRILQGDAFFVAWVKTDTVFCGFVYSFCL
jgi:hypothetical protein